MPRGSPAGFRAAAVLPMEYEARLDTIAARLAAQVPGQRPERTDAIRAAIVTGVDALEARLGITPPPADEGTAPQKEKESKPAAKPAKKSKPQK